MASSATGGVISLAGQLLGCDAVEVPGGGDARVGGAAAAATTFRGLEPLEVSPIHTSSSCEESDSSSEGTACDSSSDCDSAEGVLGDARWSGNVSVQASAFNPQASPFFLGDGPSFAVQQQGGSTTKLSVQQATPPKLSVRAHDRQLVKMLTAAMMTSGCPMQIDACKAVLCAPWVPDREFHISRINQAAVWSNGRCTGGLLRWLTQHRTKSISPPTEVFVFTVSLSEFGTGTSTSVYKYMAQPSIGGSPVTDRDRVLVKSLRAALLASGQPADLAACKAALNADKRCNRRKAYVEGGLLIWLSRFQQVFVISVSLSAQVLQAQERKKLKAEAKKLKALERHMALDLQLPAAECGLGVPAAEASLHHLSSGDVVELVQSATRLQQLLASDAALRGDARCVVAVDCEGVPHALHLMQLAYFTAGGVKRVIVVDGVAIGEMIVMQLLAPLLTSELTVKLFHDVHMDAAAFAHIGRLQLANCIDSQLVMELHHATLLMGFNKMLQTLHHSTHASKLAIKRRMHSSDRSIFLRRPLSPKLVEYAAMDAILLLSTKDRLWELLGEHDLIKIKTASHTRAQLAASSSGRRRICVDGRNNHALASRELVDVFSPESRVQGDVAMIADIVMRHDHNVLFLGGAGSGKSTIVRQAARFLAQMQRSVVVVESHTPNDTAADGVAPHLLPTLHGSCVRLLHVQCPGHVHSAVLEGLHNNTPDVMVIDEIGRSEEVGAVRACKMRGVRVIACARGDVRQVVKSTQLKGLVCGSDTAAHDDGAAHADAQRGDAPPGSVHTFTTQSTRQPLFDVIIELRCGEFNQWRIIMNTAEAVDRIVDGVQYLVQKRSLDAGTGECFLEFQRE